MALKLIVFDLDGTLADTGRDLADSVNELRRSLGLARLADARVGAHVGRGVGHLLRMTVPGIMRGFTVDGRLRRRYPELYAEFQRIYTRRCVHRTKLYAGIRGALARLPRGAVLAVATNKPGRISRRILRRLGVAGRFRAIVGGDEMRVRKPHPAVLLDLMRRYRAAPRTTVMVGDSRFDLITARRARVRSLGCTWGFGTRTEVRRERPTLLVTRPSAIPAALAKLS